MGGYGSGRPKQSKLTTECIAIDTMHFKKYLRTSGMVEGHLIVTSGAMKDNCSPGATPGLTYTIECFEGPQIDLEAAARYPVYGKLTLQYLATQGNKKQHCKLWIPLVTTPCNYGSVRWWMIAPCCGARVRAVYIGGSRMYPTCRECQDLHYQSQRSSYIEKHITYEKYLLSNYGYYWAFNEYHSLKKHYFEVTPEYEYKAAKSKLERELHIMRLFIEFERIILKTHIRAMTSLKSDDNKHVYLEHIVKEHGRGYALDLVKLLRLGIQFQRAIMEATDTSILCNFISDKAVDSAMPEAEFVPNENEPDTRRLRLLVSKELELEQELEELEKKAA
jgi:hypothetical protein